MVPGIQLTVPVSTHFGKEVPYSKNWVFYSELLWKTRWDQILQMGPELRFIESEQPRLAARQSTSCTIRA